MTYEHDPEVAIKAVVDTLNGDSLTWCFDSLLDNGEELDSYTIQNEGDMIYVSLLNEEMHTVASLELQVVRFTQEEETD